MRPSFIVDGIELARALLVLVDTRALRGIAAQLADEAAAKDQRGADPALCAPALLQRGA